jgi:predicted phage gp36 major capsid-like protein
MQRASNQYIKQKEYKKEKGDQTKTFSKGVKPEIGHTQPIPNVLSPNKIRDSI